MSKDNWLTLSQTIDGTVSEKWPEIPQLNQPTPGGQASSSGAAGFVYSGLRQEIVPLAPAT